MTSMAHSNILCNTMHAYTYCAVLTHWSVPDDGLAVGQAGLDVGQCLWADIKTHPSLFNVVDVDDLL